MISLRPDRIRLVLRAAAVLVVAGSVAPYVDDSSGLGPQVSLDVKCVGAGPVTLGEQEVAPELSRCFPLPDTLGE